MLLATELSNVLSLSIRYLVKDFAPKEVSCDVFAFVIQHEDNNQDEKDLMKFNIAV